VSHLLGAAPVLRSGRAETYTPGKDTGRYWDAGAANVHWLIATDKQVAQGIRQALGRVRASGVLVEGNSFQSHVQVDFAIMVVPQVSKQIKPTARRALARCDALYLHTEAADDEAAARARFAAWCMGAPDGALLQQIPAYTHSELPALLTRMRALPAAVLV
jgi:molybdopterin-guanine dinucleotide biosynthesis protein